MLSLEINDYLSSIENSKQIIFSIEGALDLTEIFPGTDLYILNIIEQHYKFEPKIAELSSKLISRKIFDFIRDPLLYTCNQDDEINKYSFTDIIKVYGNQWLIRRTFENYPVLIEKVLNALSNYLEYFNELNKSYEIDRKEIEEIFGNTGNMENIEWPLGDFHNNNKCNAVLIFDNGVKLIYKPKCGDNIRFFNSLVNSLKETGLDIDIISPKLLIRSDYYWEEYINSLPIDNRDDAKRFYHNTGSYLAVCYIFGISDIIFDNIIAYGSCPVLIDLECILKPGLKKSKSAAYPDLYNYFQESVVSSGILPFWAPINADEVGSMGGIIKNNTIVQVKPALVIRDDGKLGRADIGTNHNKHYLPYLEGEDKSIEISDYFSDFEQGFKEALGLFIFERNSVKNIFLELIQQFAVESRVLLRHTYVYETVLRESTHPTLLQDINQGEKILNSLYNAADENNFPDELVLSEIRQIKNSDIPYYYTYPDSYLLFSKSSEINSPVIEETGIESVLRRLGSLNQKEIENQFDLIEKSLICFGEIEYKNKLIQSSEKQLPFTSPTKEDITDKSKLIEILEEIGYFIKAGSIKTDDSVNWLEISVGRSGHWEILPKTSGIYDGTDGIGMFYLYLYKITGNSEFLEISENLLKKSIAAFKSVKLNSTYHLMSPYNFPFGTPYFLWHFNTVTNSSFENLNNLVHQHLIPLISSLIDYDIYYDMVNGSAGLLTFMADLSNHIKSVELEQSMQKVYNHIAKGAQLTEHGATWNGKNFKSLVGFAHGNAGFILAISKYYNVTKNEEALELIEKALNYNKHYYSSVCFKWLDLRSEVPSEADATWCHGAAGIILSYIKSSKLLNRDLTSPYIVAAFNDIIQNGMSGQDCLCHGSLGNYEVLVSMAELLKNDELKNVVRNELYKKVISMTGRHENWITGLNNQQYSLIGLFLGLSGISYNIMRVFWQDEIPSVLTLDSPILHH